MLIKWSNHSLDFLPFFRCSNSMIDNQTLQSSRGGLEWKGDSCRIQLRNGSCTRWIKSRLVWRVNRSDFRKKIVAIPIAERRVSSEVYADIRPRSVPALELLSRASSSVGVYSTIPTVPTQGAIPEEGGYQKKK